MINANRPYIPSDLDSGAVHFILIPRSHHARYSLILWLVPKFFFFQKTSHQQQQRTPIKKTTGVRDYKAKILFFLSWTDGVRRKTVLGLLYLQLYLYFIFFLRLESNKIVLKKERNLQSDLKK